MALNKTIIKKIKDKTEYRPEMGEFLLSLLQLESETPGWWKAKYNSILEKACEEGNCSENNKYRY